MSEDRTSETQRPRGRGARAVMIIASSLSILILVALILVMAYTSTDWGRERVRRVAVSRLQTLVHGKVTIGRITGNLLSGMTIHDFAIVDTAGHPFVAARAIRGDYGLWDLLHKRIWIRNAIVVQPTIVLDRPPNGVWNYRRIVPRDTAPHGPGEPMAWGDWIRFTDLRVIEGDVVIRTPWSPSRRLSSAAARDSAIRAVMSGDSRLLVERVPGGYQKIAALHSVTATIPLLRISDPDEKDRFMRVSALEMEALPFRPPAARIVDLKGAFPFNDDSVWWQGINVTMPGTKASGDGTYSFTTGDLALSAHAGPAASTDFRWLYPRLPSNGTGSLDFVVSWRGPVEDYSATNIAVAFGGARLNGKFGMKRGDSVTFHDSDLRFSGVDTRLVEQLIESFESPRRGTLAGRAAFHGGRNALVVDGDVTFSDARGAGTSRVLAQGEIGFPGAGVRARSLRLDLRPFQVELMRTWAPTLPISGVITGVATVTGNTATDLRVVANLDHRDRGTESRVTGTIAARNPGGARRRATASDWSFDADLQTHPISLVELGRFFPDVGLQGSASGPVRLRGTMANLDVRSDLRLSDGGRLGVNGNLALAGSTKRYDVAANLYTLNLRTLLAKAPRTSLTARATIRGAGTDPETMQAVVAAELGASRWDSVAVDTASIRASIGGGLVQVAKLDVSGGHTFATARGSFGLTRNRTGTLSYNVMVDSLAAFNRWIPGGNVFDTARVAPRPGLVAKAVAEARADSARIAKKTEVERFVTGKAPPRLQVAMPRSVRRDTIGGVMYAAGTLSGNIHDFDLRGRAGGENISIRGNFARRVAVEYAWSDVRTPASKLVAALDADSLMAGGFALDTVNARVTYANRNGHAEIAVRQGGAHDYAVNGDFTLAPSGNEVRIARMTARLDTALWSAPHASSVKWGGPGIEVVNFELVNRSNGRIYANGLLPTEGVANFELAVDNLPAQDIVDLLQSDVGLTGQITMQGAIRGTLSNPTFRGAFGIANGTYRGTELPLMQGRLAYAGRELQTHIEAFRQAGSPIATLDGTLPINLALSGVTGSRFLDAPMAVTIEGDSLPLELIPHFTDAVSNVHGLAAGRVTLRGKLNRPTVTGGLVIANTSVRINSTGQMIEGLCGTVRMVGDSIFVGDRPAPCATARPMAVAGLEGVNAITGYSGGPLYIRGSVAVGDWRAPKFDLYFYGSGARVLNNKYGELRADVGLALKGSLDAPYVSGSVVVVDGVIRPPEPTGRHVISGGDPALFNVLDTSLTRDRELFPPRPSMLKNMRLEVEVQVRRDTWVRTRDANVEIFTDYPVFVVMQDEALAVRGVVTTDRGEYSFLSKRFQIRRGSAMFVGIPDDLNPTLQITGEYEVSLPSSAAIAIKVLIGGTLRRPTLALESDVQPPKSQGELFSLLAFGQSSTSLLSVEGSSIAALGTGADLVGLGAGLAVRRLAGVAMGVAIDEVESEAGKALGTDYLNITPADVPTEVWQGRGIGNILTQTRIEAGKYLNARTFLGIQTVGVNPGVNFQYRTAKGWRYEASIQPRVLLAEPSLSKQVLRTRQSYGGFIIKEWRY